MRNTDPTRAVALVGAVAAAVASGNPWVSLLTGVILGLVVKDDNDRGHLTT
ncbi:hypothetical protein GCM10023317_11980 [Actinopolymorpha pittospori]|uniref:Uncharacterized protein n=1 Tax=Actinopolymorpha pittospori TaxID=648752 RepID=A0A927MSV5_9ACTN|nr:hypothetical protein [Actinopolymorpha pittospori]